MKRVEIINLRCHRNEDYRWSIVEYVPVPWLSELDDEEEIIVKFDPDIGRFSINSMSGCTDVTIEMSYAILQTLLEVVKIANDQGLIKSEEMKISVRSGK